MSAISSTSSLLSFSLLFCSSLDKRESIWSSSIDRVRIFTQVNGLDHLSICSGVLSDNPILSDSDDRGVRLVVSIVYDSCPCHS